MKRVFLAAAAVASLSACASGYDEAPRGGGYAAFDAYYDGFYGPYYDGYWGPEGGYYYSPGQGRPYVRDDGRHFRRDTYAGFTGVHGHGRRPDAAPAEAGVPRARADVGVQAPGVGGAVGGAVGGVLGKP